MPDGATPDTGNQQPCTAETAVLVGDAKQPRINRKRLMTVTKALALPAAALILGGTLFAGSRSAFSAPTVNTGNLAEATALNPPTGPTGTCGTAIDLKWTATPDSYATGHRVLRATTPGGPYSQVAEITPRTTTTYADSPASGLYYYVVRAYFQNWESLDSIEVSGSTPCPTFGAVADSDAQQGDSDTNFGTDDEMTVRSRSVDEHRSYVRFDTSSIPAGATIDSATMTLCLNQPVGQTRIYDVHRITSSWVETTLTWNLQPTAAVAPTDSTTIPTGVADCATWTVTADVQAWVDGTANNGWRITDSVIGPPNTTGRFRTREDGAVPAEQPKLTVVYSTG